MWTQYSNMHHSLCNITADGYVYKHGRLIGYPSWFVTEEYDKRHIECRVVDTSGLLKSDLEDSMRRMLAPDVILSPYIDRWEQKPPVVAVDGEFVSRIYSDLRELRNSAAFVGFEDAFEQSLVKNLPDGDVVFDFRCVDLAFSLSTTYKTDLFQFFFYVLVPVLRNCIVHAQLTLDNNEYENRTFCHASNVLYYFLENLVYHLLTKNSSRNNGLASLEIVDKCKPRVDDAKITKSVLQPVYVRRAMTEAFRLSSWVGDGSVDSNTLCIRVGHLKAPSTVEIRNVNAPVSYVKYNSECRSEAYFGSAATFVLDVPNDRVFNWAVVKCNEAHVEGLHFPIPAISGSHTDPVYINYLDTCASSIRVLDMGYFTVPAFFGKHEYSQKFTSLEYLRCGSLQSESWYAMLHENTSPVAFEWNNIVRILDSRTQKPCALIKLISDHTTHIGLTHPDDLYWLTPELDANSWTSASFVDIPPYELHREYSAGGDVEEDSNIVIITRDRWPFVNLFKVKISVVEGGPLCKYLDSCIFKRDTPLLPHLQTFHVRCPIDMFTRICTKHLKGGERLQELTVYCETRFCDNRYIQIINQICKTATRLRSLSIYSNPSTTAEYILNNIQSQSLQSLYLLSNNISVPGMSVPVMYGESELSRKFCVDLLKKSFPNLRYCLCAFNHMYNMDLSPTPALLRQNFINPPTPISSVREENEDTYLPAKKPRPPPRQQQRPVEPPKQSNMSETLLEQDFIPPPSISTTSIEEFKTPDPPLSSTTETPLISEVDSVKNFPSSEDGNSINLSNLGNKPSISTVYADGAVYSDTSVEAKRVFENDQVGRDVVQSMQPKPTFPVNPYLLKGTAQEEYDEDI